MTITRRAALALTAAAIAAAPAAAIEPPAAEDFVRAVVADFEAILKSEADDAAKTQAFMALFRRTAALPQIGRFAAGQAWREMTDAQKDAYAVAFERYAANAYTRNIGEYRGQTVEVTGSQDAGRRGVLVQSLFNTPGEAPIRVDWLVSDQSGQTLISDVVAEGVSLTIAQREEFAAMLEARGGDIDRFIADLGA